MHLFDNASNPDKNLLPYDGIVHYYGKIFDKAQADIFLTRLRDNINWKQDEVMMYGKRIITKRKTAWYGDNTFEYVYSGIGRKAMLWINVLKAIRSTVEQSCQESFNSCLLNLYHTGEETMSWHSDNEKTLKPQAAIASVSFGAERKFSFRHRQTKETVSLLLEHGSLLVMKGITQVHWLHQMPVARRIKDARINLTFRTFIETL